MAIAAERRACGHCENHGGHDHASSIARAPLLIEEMDYSMRFGPVTGVQLGGSLAGKLSQDSRSTRSIAWPSLRRSS